MTDEPSIRSAERDDADRIHEIASSRMTADYALSPQDIEAIVDAEFDPDELRDRFDREGITAFVAEIDAEDGTVLAGFVEVGDDDGDDDGDDAIRWLHVDPERRGQGVGTALFERALEELSSRGVDEPRALALEANTSSGAFFERFDFAQADQREVEFGGSDLVEYIFAEGASGDDAAGAGSPDAGAESDSDAADESDQADADSDDADAAASAPDAERDVEAADLPDSVTAEEGKTVAVGDEPIAGNQGGFVPTFVDDDRTEQYGYYCLNCESTDVSMDSMERIRCENCGNTRRPDEDYDDSYL